MTVGWEREEGKTGAVKLTEGLSVLDREGVFYLGDGKEAQVHVYLREEYDIFAGAGRLRVRGGGERSGRPAPRRPAVDLHPGAKGRLAGELRADSALSRI